MGQEFRARSGRVVKVDENGTVVFDHVNGYLSPGSAMDAEEFFQAKRDEELGRWRWPENPQWVVYAKRPGYSAIGTADLLVINEADGSAMEYVATDDDGTCYTGREESAAEAGRAYFEAHPERPLPTENGVYVPASADLDHGPLTFVLYEGAWRATPGIGDAAEAARDWHSQAGLVRLCKVEGKA